MRKNNRVNMDSSTGGTGGTVFCNVSLFYFSISNVLCRKKRYTHVSSLCSHTAEVVHM